MLTEQLNIPYSIEPFSAELAERYLEEAEVFAFDIETDTRNYHWREGEEKTDGSRGLSFSADMTHISFAAPGLPAMVLVAQPHDLEYTAVTVEEGQLVEGPFTRKVYEFDPDEKEFLFLLFTRPKYTAIAHNLVFDARQILGKFGIWKVIPPGATFWDTSVINLLIRAKKLTRRQERPPSLNDLEEFHDLIDPKLRAWWSGMKPYRKKLHLLSGDDEASVKYRRNAKRALLPPGLADDANKGKGWSLEEGETAVFVYSAMDSIVALLLYEAQQEWPKYEVIPSERVPYSYSFEELLATDLDYTKWAAITSARGIRLNVPYVEQQRARHFARLIECAGALGLEPADVFVPRGKDWRIQYVFSRVEEPSAETIQKHPYLLTNKGSLSLDKQSLEFYLETEPSLAALRDYNRADTLYRRAEEFLHHAEYDGRIHTTMDRNTITGRNSSSSPNLQNLSFSYDKRAGQTLADTQAGWLIADDGYVLVELDYSNAENWSQAMISGDHIFADACTQSDFHSAMAAGYFADAWKEALRQHDKAALKRMRFEGKSITFGVPYGLQAKSLAADLSAKTGREWTPEEAQELLDAKDRAFQGVASAMKKSKDFANQHGFVPLWTGRQVSVTMFNGRYKGYTGWNGINQGGIGELVVRAILSILHNVLEKEQFLSWISLQIHDSIILQLKISEYQTLPLKVIEQMATIIPDAWNNRTDPPIRWLTDIEHASNATKWGYVPGEEYPFPLDEYINRWGYHKLPEGMDERPVWINEWGWGERALAIERGEIGPDEEYTPKPVEETPLEPLPPFDWRRFRQAFNQAEPYIGPITYNGRVFEFHEAVEVLRTLAHKGHQSAYKDMIVSLDQLAEVIGEYIEWRKTI